ncbi:MAG TPA: ATP-binding protein [Terriglobales bacterium]|nr:ATP-binding protein [Terriglobales bacterium]
MAPDPKKREEVGGRHRRTLILVLGIAIFLLFALVFSQQAFKLTLRPTTSEQALIFVALSTLIFLLLIALTFVLLRNLLKLYTERRTGKLGSKFRTRMVVGALALSLTPVIFLFLFAYGLMNRSIDKWFSRPVEELREDSGEIARQLSTYAAENARAEAASIAAVPETQRAFATGNFSSVITEFRRREGTLQGGFALATSDDAAVASFHAPEAWVFLRPQLPPLARLDPARPEALKLGGREYMLGSARVGDNGRILVAMPLPPQFSATLRQMEANQRMYFELARQRKLVRRTYMGLLLLLTVLVLFAATWFALFLSKLVTRPVAALAEAMQEVSRGRLDYRLDMVARDELGQLVASFNRMATELEASRRQLEASSREVADANVALEQRRRHMETILESIPTGVLSLDANRRVTHTNDAFSRMFARGNDHAPAQGTALRDIFNPEVAEDLLHLLRKADRMGTTTSQTEVTVEHTVLTLAVTAASLHHRGERQGYVVVFEDLSDLLHAQKQAAWREVARRIAHEIKNPLTPIALSAERIRRHLERDEQPDAASLAVIEGCAQTIAGAVETVRTLVDEFSTLARFPASRPQPANINAIVENALAMFNGRLDGIQITTLLAPDLPPVMADAEAMKRALANLVDNAAEAMQDSMVKEVQISTALADARDSVEVVIADTGHGVTPELKEKLFLPYFSTKGRGTGLGLAIVSRIVEDHHGSIRVEENSPVGARFIVELPVAMGEMAAVQHA